MIVIGAVLLLVLLRLAYSVGEICFEHDWPRRTWRGLAVALMLLILCCSAFGQAVRVDIPVQTSGPNVPVSGGPLPQALWVSNATVALCAHPQPTFAGCQANPLLTYTDSSEGTECLSTKPLVQLPGTTCTASTGATANIGFWYAGGLFDYFVTTSYGTFGPYSGNSGGGGSGSGTVISSTENQLAAYPVTGASVRGAVAGPVATPNLSGKRFVDGFNSWSNAYGLGTTITVAYADACISGGTVEVSQYYVGTEATPPSCAALSIGSPAQPYPQVIDDRQGQTAYTGALSGTQFGSDQTGTNSSNANLTAMLAASHSGTQYNSAIGNSTGLYFPPGTFTFNETAISSTYPNVMLQGATGASPTRFYYGGAGGANSYLLALPGLNSGGLQNIQVQGVNVGYHTSVTGMAQNCLLQNQGTPGVDALARFTGVALNFCYGDGMDFGSPTQPGGVTNGFFDHFRFDGIGGYGMRFYGNGTADGNPLDLGNWTNANLINGAIASYAIAQGYAQGSGSTTSCYGSGSFFFSKLGGEIINAHDFRHEEDTPLCNIGNADESVFWFNDDTSSSVPIMLLSNMGAPEAAGAPHPIISTATGHVSLTLLGNNFITGATGVYKNRQTGQEYGDRFSVAAALWSVGKLASEHQGISLENQWFDVIPVASRSSNNALWHLSDILYRHLSDFVPGASGPYDVVVSPTNGGRASLQATAHVTLVGTLAANSTFTPNGLATLTAGTGGTISGVGVCTLSGFNNGLEGAAASVTFTTSGSWSGATFVILSQGWGATTASGLTATLTSGSTVTTGATATCSGTATLTATIGAASVGTYANITGFSPATAGLHLGDNLTMPNTGSSGSGATAVTVSCIDQTGSGSECTGLGAQGIVVTAEPACLPSSCPAGGALEVDWVQATLSNFGLEANRVSTLPTAGTSCPYQGDIEWPLNPVAGSKMNSWCNSSLQWVDGPVFGATAQTFPGAGVANSTGSAWGASYTVGTSGSDLAQLSGANAWGALQTFTDGINLPSTTAPLELAGSAGTSGNCLISGGTGVTPSWGSCGSGSGVTLDTNSVNNSSQSLLNFKTSTTNAVGLTVTPVNPSGGIELEEVTGTLTAGGGGTGSSSVPSSGQIPVGNTGGTAYAPVALSGDCTLTYTGAITCLDTNGTAFAGLATLTETNGDIVYGSGGVWTKGTALPNGITATTQAGTDNTTKVATDAFVQGLLPTTIAAVSHKYLTSYTASSETFTAAQPVSADLSDLGSAGGAAQLNGSGYLPTTQGGCGAACGTFAAQNYATPPVIGGTTPNTINASALYDTGSESGSGYACLHINNVGLISNTGSDCGSGSGNVASFSGDGTIVTNSGSTGNVTMTLAGTSGGVPYFASASSWASSAALANHALVTGGGAGAGPATGNADFTYTTHTLAAGASGLVDFSAITSTAGFRVPGAPTNTASAAGAVTFDSTNKNYHGYVNGADSLFLNIASAPSNNDALYAVISSGNLLMADAGYAYNSIPNADLAHSAITIAGTSVSLGGSTSSLPSPGAIGGTTPSTGAFTTLTASTSIADTAVESATGLATSSGGVLQQQTAANVGAIIDLAQYDIVESNGTSAAPVGIACGADTVMEGSATNPSCTATPQLGLSGTLGSLTMGNATSGTITLEPATGALGTITEYLPVASGDTLAGIAATQTLTNKSIAGSEINSSTVGVTYGGLGANNSSSTGVVQFASGTESVSTALASGTTATTQSACDNSTKIATTAYTGVACNTVQTSGSPFSLTAQSQTQWNNTSGAYVWDLPATASGIQVCIGNYKTVAHAISLVPPSGSTIYYKGVAGTTSSSTGLVSGGAAGDFICVEGVDSTTWEAIGGGQGTWTNN